ncbi:creatininase family protein [Algoriphagus persicinus]|uniref:creatininase family protein n=1 Tax=Algoriphagus persicinus TaxID=3108754 RepID=UPI002B36C238|nr:creatininase family protein [Algoriphagus sp. E1-3-M2]MEB2784278.1 creatininase family protein [Algoriphagus sp. E1-3-M2]
MNLINWMEFVEFALGQINTVLLPNGTFDPHGVVNNGADNTAPTALARAIAEDLNALIAPTLNYGITGSMAAFPSTFQITEDAYRPFIRDIQKGLAKNGFNNIIKKWDLAGFYTSLF